MKIGVTAEGMEIDSPVDPRFGRAAYVLVIDTDSMSFEVLDNQENKNALKGAGIQAASMISDHGADILLTGHCGPNAFKVLKAAGIGVANHASGTVREAVDAYLKGKMPLAEEADVEEQW